MKVPKNVISILVILILLVGTILASCKRSDMHLKEPTHIFPEIEDRDSYDNLSLTIYYMSPYIFTSFPMSIDGLIKRCLDSKIVISGDQLIEHIDLLSQLNYITLIPLDNDPYRSVRIYYVFEDENEGEIFDVAMWGKDDKSMYVNGQEVEGNAIFCDVIMPFLSDDEANELDKWMNRGK